MKRLFVDDADIAILSDRIFAKRLRIDDSHLSNISGHLKIPGRLYEASNQIDTELSKSETISVNHPFPSLNPTLAELHQEREERKRRKTNESSSTNLFPNQLIGYPHDPSDYPHTRNRETSLRDLVLNETKFLRNSSSHFRKQLQYERDYHSRCGSELRNEFCPDIASAVEEPEHKLGSKARQTNKFSMTSESCVHPGYDFDSEMCQHQPHHYMSAGSSPLRDCQDQMDVD